MKEHYHDVGQSDWEESQEKPVILDGRRLEKLLRILVRKVAKVVDGQNSAGSKICARIYVLEAKSSPKGMFEG